MARGLIKVPSKFKKRVNESLKYVSDEIQGRRVELGLTQEELAEELGLSPMTIQFIEQGRRYPSLPTLIYILSYLKLSFKIGR